MTNRIIRTLAAVGLIAILPALAGAADYERAEKLGKIDLSYGCPKGAKWYPDNGGECRSCRKGWEPVAGKCRRIIPPVAERAIRDYRRPLREKKCRRGTFRALGSRWCYRCRDGLRHNKALPVGVPGVCYSLEVVESRSMRVVKEMSVRELLDPKTALAEVSTLGCEGQRGKNGGKAFFDPISGGTCWSCPKSHPVRTLYGVNGPKACASEACGAEGGRPCYVWERSPSCDPGLIEDPFSNACVKPKDFACATTLRSVRRLKTTIEEANRLGEELKEEALNRIPGLAEAKRFAQNQAAQVQKQMTKVIQRLPVDRVLADLDVAIPSPEVAERIDRVTAAISRRVDRIEEALLDSDAICTGDVTTLKQIFEEALAEAGVVPGETGTDLAELLGPSKAHAARRRVLGGWTIAYSFAPVVNARVKAVTVPLQLLGLQVAVEVGETTSDDLIESFGVFLTFGVDLISVPQPEITQLGALEQFITFSWPEVSEPLCDAEWWGTGLVVLDRVGFGFGCKAFSSISLKFYAHDVIDQPAKFMTGVAADWIKQVYTGVRVERRKWSPSPAVTFGPNFALPLAPGTDEMPQVGYAQ